MAGDPAPWAVEEAPVAEPADCSDIFLAFETICTELTISLMFVSKTSPP